jgi:hypothetical protein
MKLSALLHFLHNTKMFFSYYFSTILATTSLSLSSAVKPIQRRCTARESCWPDVSTWQDFNSSLSGHLVATYPSAAVCYTAHYDAALCSVARQNWTNNIWRTSQPGVYSAILWELGQDQCLINNTTDAPCGQGRVAEYSGKAHGIEDIQAAAKFADQHDLYLVVKNTGHDHLGRSGGSGAFSIWIHNMKGRVWHSGFVPSSASNSIISIPATTSQARKHGLRSLETHSDLMS